MSGIIVAIWFIFGIVGVQMGNSMDLREGNPIDQSCVWYIAGGPIVFILCVIFVISRNLDRSKNREN